MDVVKVTIRDQGVFAVIFEKSIPLIFNAFIPDFHGMFDGQCKELAIIQIASDDKAQYSYNTVKSGKQYMPHLEHAIRNNDFQAVARYSAMIETENHTVKSKEYFGVTLKAIWNGSRWNVQRVYDLTETESILNLEQYRKRWQGVFSVKKIG